MLTSISFLDVVAEHSSLSPTSPILTNRLKLQPDFQRLQHPWEQASGKAQLQTQVTSPLPPTSSAKWTRSTRRSTSPSATTYVCLRTKITKAPCRRRADEVLLCAEKFGALITADHKVLNEGCESRDDHWSAVVAQDLATQWIQSYPCETKSPHETEKKAC